MIRSKTLIAAAVGGLLCASPLAAPSASAQGMGGHMARVAMSGMHGGSPFLMLLRSADLTPAQKSQVHLILSSNRTQMMSLHRQLMALHEQISDKLLGAGSVSSADLKPLVQKASDLEAKLNQDMADTAVAIRNVLTPEQVKKLADVHKKLHDLHTQVQQLMGSEQNMPDTDD
ncbi:MAG TPA: Spy/CpxP family protein refolding chaperone [Rhizomicrobium sp.]|jgi:Spy/CpxP family protein refolding chaperone